MCISRFQELNYKAQNLGQAINNENKSIPLENPKVVKISQKRLKTSQELIYFKERRKPTIHTDLNKYQYFRRRKSQNKRFALPN